MSNLSNNKFFNVDKILNETNKIILDKNTNDHIYNNAINQLKNAVLDYNSYQRTCYLNKFLNLSNDQILDNYLNNPYINEIALRMHSSLNTYNFKYENKIIKIIEIFKHNKKEFGDTYLEAKNLMEAFLYNTHVYLCEKDYVYKKPKNYDYLMKKYKIKTTSKTSLFKLLKYIFSVLFSDTNKQIYTRDLNFLIHNVKYPGVYNLDTMARKNITPDLALHLLMLSIYHRTSDVKKESDKKIKRHKSWCKHNRLNYCAELNKRCTSSSNCSYYEFSIDKQNKY